MDSFRSRSTLKIGSKEFTLEVADTMATQEHGLMQRDSMPPSHGMIFVFADETDHDFYMKNTRIPLDIVFIRPDGRVLSWSRDQTLRVWNLATGEGHPLTGHEGSVDGALALADRRVLSWSQDGTLRVWDLTTGAGRPLRGQVHESSAQKSHHHLCADRLHPHSIDVALLTGDAR